MPEIKLVKKYPHIKDEDVTSIFQEGYIKGFENGRKGAIPIAWIKAWVEQFIDDKGFYSGEGYDSIWDLLEAWEKENADVN